MSFLLSIASVTAAAALRLDLVMEAAVVMEEIVEAGEPANCNLEGARLPLLPALADPLVRGVLWVLSGVAESILMLNKRRYRRHCGCHFSFFLFQVYVQ